MLEDAAETFFALDRFESWQIIGRVGFAIERDVADALMRPLVVVMSEVFVKRGHNLRLPPSGTDL